MLRDELLQLADELRVAPERQIGVDPLLDGGDAQLLEAPDRRLRERLVAKVGERPGRARARVRVRSSSAARRGSASAASPASRSKASEIELSVGDVGDVARRSRLDSVCQPRLLAEVGDMALHLLDGAYRGLAGVEIVGEPVDRDDPVRVQEEDGERRPLLRPAEPDLAALVGDLERSQDPELEQRGRGPYPFDTGSGPRRPSIGPFGKSREEQ